MQALLLGMLFSLMAIESKAIRHKGGAAYTDYDALNALSKHGSIGWAYNWSLTESTASRDGVVDFTPMIWGRADAGIENVGRLMQRGYRHILGFNEPDISSQANMTPYEAAVLYEHLHAAFEFNDKFKLTSPAVSSSTTKGKGLDWIRQFKGNLSSFNVPILAVHWYGTSADELQAFVKEAARVARELYMSEIWLTEFGLTTDIHGISNIQATKSFLQEAIPWLECHPDVARYAFFMCAEGYLISNGQPNEVGETYELLSNASHICSRNEESTLN